MTIIDIDNWSKEAVEGYLKNNIPLNTTIEKIASQNGLNKDQIHRVVEAANTDTYTNLFNKSTDKYIHYDVADADKIYESLHEVKTAEATTTDYNEPPEYDLPDQEIIKIAEGPEPPISPEYEMHEYYKLADTESRLQQKLDELELSHQQDNNIFYSMVKQAVLGGESFGDINHAITTLYDDKVIKESLRDSQEKLAQEIYPRLLNLTPTPDSIGAVNRENPLIKQAESIIKHAEEYKTVREKHKEAKCKAQEHIKKAMKPATKALIGAAALTTTFGAGMTADHILKAEALQNEIAKQYIKPREQVR
jgi:hypothetical protein